MTTPLTNGTSEYFLPKVFSGIFHCRPPNSDFSSHRLRPFENEIVSGDMRVQITFEQYQVRDRYYVHVPGPDSEYFRQSGH
jgi:hypothetical protein